MANLPPNDLNANLFEDEPVQPEHAPIMLGFLPAMLNIQNNNNGWIEEDEEEEMEAKQDDEEEMKAEDDDEMDAEVNDDESDAESIYPYEEADPLNRPPSDPETVEREFMNALVGRSTLQPLPPICHFTITFYDRYRVECLLFKRFKGADKRMDSFNDDLSALDSELRKQIQDHAEMKRDAAAIVPIREDDDDPAVPSDPQSPQPCDH
nr:hypothetical protein [Tanacetum cinerariifolium]